MSMNATTLNGLQRFFAPNYQLIVCLFALCLATGCQQDGNDIQTESTAGQVVESKPIDQEIIDAYDNMSFALDNGLFMQYICDDGGLKIEYGNDDLQRQLPENLPCLAPNSGTPVFWTHSQDFLLLKYACGLSCWGTWVLPLNEDEDIRKFKYQMAFDEASNRLVYIDYENANTTGALTIIDLVSDQAETVELPRCIHPFLGTCIDNIQLEGDQLSIQFQAQQLNSMEENATEPTQIIHTIGL